MIDKDMKPSEMTQEQALQYLEEHPDVNGAKRHWIEIKAGLKEQPEGQGQRGHDLAPRTTKKRMELAARMKDAYGFDIHEEIAKHMGTVSKMAELANEIEKDDLEAGLNAHKAVAQEHGKFISTLLPYVESKKAQRTTEDEADLIQVDDLDALVQKRLESDED